MTSQIVNGIDLNTIQSSQDLLNLLDQVEDFDLRKLIRMRLKEVKDAEKEERNAFFNRIENQRELSLQKKLKDQMEDKQRYLNMYDQMAKQPASDKKTLDINLYKDNTKKMVSAKDKFKIMDQQANPSSTKTAPKTSFSPNSPAAIKDNLLKWSSFKTRGYPHVNITNFSSSWCDGMAFCALVHRYFPDAFDFNTLDPKNRRHNFELAFKTAEEKADVFPLLDVDDMIMMKNKPDQKCVFCYVQSLYKSLRKFD